MEFIKDILIVGSYLCFNTRMTALSWRQTLLWLPLRTVTWLAQGNTQYNHTVYTKHGIVVTEVNILTLNHPNILGTIIDISWNTFVNTWTTYVPVSLHLWMTFIEIATDLTTKFRLRTTPLNIIYIGSILQKYDGVQISTVNHLKNEGSIHCITTRTLQIWTRFLKTPETHYTITASHGVVSDEFQIRTVNCMLQCLW